MAETVHVSVVMAVFNTRKEYLVSALKSILGQTFDNFEFILIDDKSTDGSLNILKDYASRDDRIRVITNDDNIGLTRSLNRGLKIARGKYIARMDADDVSFPERLQIQYDYMEKNPDTVVLGSFVYCIEKDKPAFRDFALFPEIAEIQMLFGNAGVAHPTAFIRREFLEKHNITYDERILKSQDYSLWLECNRYGGKIEVLPQFLLMYRIHEGQVTSNRTSQSYFADMVREKALEYFLGQCTEEDVEIHCGISREGILYEPNAVLGHLKNLENHNDRVEKYNRVEFKTQLKCIWLKLCLKSLLRFRRTDYLLNTYTFSCLSPRVIYVFYKTYLYSRIVFTRVKKKFEKNQADFLEACLKGSKEVNCFGKTS